MSSNRKLTISVPSPSVHAPNGQYADYVTVTAQPIGNRKPIGPPIKLKVPRGNPEVSFDVPADATSVDLTCECGSDSRDTVSEVLSVTVDLTQPVRSGVVSGDSVNLTLLPAPGSARLIDLHGDIDGEWSSLIGYIAEEEPDPEAESKAKTRAAKAMKPLAK